MPSGSAAGGAPSGWAPGGRAVLDTMEKQLKLSEHYMEPSRAGLYRFGNVSSTSVWYVLAWDELRSDVRSFRIDRITSIEVTRAGFRVRPPDAFIDAVELDARTL